MDLKFFSASTTPIFNLDGMFIFLMMNLLACSFCNIATDARPNHFVYSHLWELFSMVAKWSYSTIPEIDA